MLALGDWTPTTHSDTSVNARAGCNQAELRGAGGAGPERALGRRTHVGTARLGLVCLWCVCAAGAADSPQARLAHLVHVVRVVSVRTDQHSVRGQALQLGAARRARPTAPLGQLAHSGRRRTGCDRAGRRRSQAVACRAQAVARPSAGWREV